MIWLFKVNEVFWNNKPKINEYYIFDTNDIQFDITQYDISLYFGLADYYLLNDSNKKLYYLRFSNVDVNPIRILVSESTEIYDDVRNFFRKLKLKKIMEL